MSNSTKLASVYTRDAQVIEVQDDIMPDAPATVIIRDGNYQISLIYRSKNLDELSNLSILSYTGESLYHIYPIGSYVTYSTSDDYSNPMNTVAQINGKVSIFQGPTNVGKVLKIDSDGYVVAGQGSGAIWGGITGTLSDQTDLQNELNAKQNTLTFDTTPTENSTNPVTSGGVYTSLSTKLGTVYTSTEDNYLAKVDPTDHVLKVMNVSTTVAFADITGNATDNTSLATELNSKQTVANLITSWASASNTNYPSAELVKTTLNDYELTANKISTWSSIPDNTKYPTEKLVKDTIDSKQDILPTAFVYTIPPNANLVKSSKDSNGVYLVYTWELGTAVSGYPAKWISTVSADYLTRTMVVYSSDKTTTLATYTFTRTLDSDGNLVSEVLN